MNRLLAVALSGALILLSPGLAGYQAFAAVKAAGEPGPVHPSMAAPVAPSADIPALEPQLPVSLVPSTPVSSLAAATARTAPAAFRTRRGQAPRAGGQRGVGRLARNPDVQAAVDAAHPSGQGQAFERIYEGVGPREEGALAFSENGRGPIFHARYRPAAALQRPSPVSSDSRGKVHILVGSGKAYERGWASEWTKRVVDEIAANEVPGLKLLVIDAADKRPEGADHFIAADIDDLSEENRGKVAELVNEYLKTHGLEAVGANTLQQAYVRWTPVVQNAVRRFNNAAILAHPVAAAEAVADKFAMRQIVGERIESLRWPAQSPGAIDDPDIERKALEAFREIQKQTPSGKVVLKLATSAGKAAQRVGGIATEEELIVAIRDVKFEIETFWKAQDADIYNTYLESDKNGSSRFLIEGMIDALTEVDAELAISLLPDGTLDILGTIIGNPNPGHAEKGYVFGMKGLLSEELQRELLLAAVQAVVAVWDKFGALPFGNFHTELMLRGDPLDPKAALVEINALRPIGGNGIRWAREWSEEFDLVRAAVRASLGLPQIPVSRQPQDTFLLLGITPRESGTVMKAEVPLDLPRAVTADFGKTPALTQSVHAPIYLSLAELATTLERRGSPHPGALGAVALRAKNAPAAVRKMLRTFKKLFYEILTSSKGLIRQRGDDEHSSDDYVPLPR